MNKAIEYIVKEYWDRKPFCQYTDKYHGKFSNVSGIQEQLDSMSNSSCLIFFMRQKPNDPKVLEIVKMAVGCDDHGIIENLKELS